ncbi:MAG: DUF3185 family protein [Puniceicoccaceae bacterium]|nr:MAG: DUF3185 family protein [Puniceicoccaceae bacterium]
MPKSIAIALVIVGVVLMLFGFNASESIQSEVSEAVTGTPSNHSIWLFALGLVALIAGGSSLVLKH